MENDYKVEKTVFGTKTSHPSYGTLAFTRRTSGATPLFGSSIEHRDTIAMTLYHADITRELHEDYIYKKARKAHHFSGGMDSAKNKLIYYKKIRIFKE